MELLCKIAFWISLIWICVHASAKKIQLRDVCVAPDDNDILICQWQSVGEYVSDAKNLNVRRIEFDRLTNSVVNFRNLENVNTLEIQSKFLDTYTECQHVVENVQAISVEVERQPSVSCIPTLSTTSNTVTSIRAATTSSSTGRTAVEEPVTTMDTGSDMHTTVGPSSMTDTDTTFPATLGIQTLKKLLTGTTPAYSAGNKFRNHEKLGDLDTALRDFYSVQPIKVTSTINSQGVKVIKGKSGNRALSLQTNSFKGYPILDIIDYNSKHKGGRYVDRILYKTGDMKKYQRNPENKAE